MQKININEQTMPLSAELQQALNLFLAKIDQINPYDAKLQKSLHEIDTDTAAQRNFKQYCDDYILQSLDIPHNRYSILSLACSEYSAGTEAFFLQLLQNKQRIDRFIFIQQYYPYPVMHIMIGLYCSILNTNTQENHFLVKQQFETFFFGVLDKNPTLLIRREAYPDAIASFDVGPFGNKTSWLKKWDHIFPLYFSYLASKKNPPESSKQEENVQRTWDEKSLTQKIQTVLTNIKKIWNDIKPIKANTFESCFPQTNHWLDTDTKNSTNSQIDRIHPIQSVFSTVSGKNTIASIEDGLSQYVSHINTTSNVHKRMAYDVLMKNNKVMSAIFTALSNSSRQTHDQKNPVLSELRTTEEFKSKLIVKAAANRRHNPENAMTSGIDYLIHEHTSFFRRGRTHSGDVAERISLAAPFLSSNLLSDDSIGIRFINEANPINHSKNLSEQVAHFISALGNLLDRMEKRNKDPVKINLVYNSFKTLAESLKESTTADEILAKIDIWEEEGHHEYHDKILTNKALLNENRNSWWQKKTTQLMEDFLQLKAELEVVKQNTEQTASKKIQLL